MITLSNVPRPATGKTPTRTFRIPDDLYDPAQQIAEARGESLTDVVKRALAAYVKRHQHEAAGAKPKD